MDILGDGYDVFIAYASPDRAHADKLFELLSPHYRVFLDHKTIPKGADYDAALGQGIEQSRVVVVLVTTYTERAFFQRFEIQRSLTLAREAPDRHVVVPVYLGIAPAQAAKNIYGLGLKQGIECHLEGGGLVQVAAELGTTLRPNAKPSPHPPASDDEFGAVPAEMPDLVGELEQRLIERERHKVDDVAYARFTRRIDNLVERIIRQARFKPGDLVAGTELVKPIGSGNFATIWLAKVPANGALVATKIFHVEKLTEGTMLWRFRRSVRAMARLSEDGTVRRNIVRIHEVDPSTLAFSMEYLSEGNLEDVARRGWTLATKISVMISLCRAVEHAHLARIIHRDIKPANVVLNRDREPVLTDFDIADIKFVTRLSVAEGGLGTPVFAAPEQLADADSADERSDVYSLGRLLYFLLLERSPGYEIERDPSLAKLSGYPASIVSIVRRATQYMPRDRFRSAAEMSRALETYSTRAAKLRTRARLASRWLRMNAALLTIFTVILVGVAVVAVLQQHRALTEQSLRKRAEELQQALARALADMESATARYAALEIQERNFEREITERHGHVEELRLQANQLSLGSHRRADLERQISEERTKVTDLLQKRHAVDLQLSETLESLESAHKRAKEARQRSMPIPGSSAFSDDLSLNGTIKLIAFSGRFVWAALPGGRRVCAKTAEDGALRVTTPEECLKISRNSFLSPPSLVCAVEKDDAMIRDDPSLREIPCESLSLPEASTPSGLTGALGKQQDAGLP